MNQKLTAECWPQPFDFRPFFISNQEKETKIKRLLEIDTKENGNEDCHWGGAVEKTKDN